MKQTQRVLDLFCGAGGFSLGFRNAGFQIVAGIDNDAQALATFARNFPEAHAINLNLADPESHLQYMVVWGSDYPHNPISWPGTADLMSWLMKDVPEDVYFDAVYGRVAKFFELKDPPGLVRSKPFIQAKAS